MKKFKDLTEGDTLYEVYSQEIIAHEVAGNVTVDKQTMIPVKSKKGDDVYLQTLPKSKCKESSYKYPNIYRGYYTDLGEAKEELRKNLLSFKENAEWKLKEAREVLLRAENCLKSIEDKLAAL